MAFGATLLLSTTLPFLNPESPSPAVAITVPRQAPKRHAANVLEGGRTTYARKRIHGVMDSSEPWSLLCQLWAGGGGAAQTFACRQRVMAVH